MSGRLRFWWLLLGLAMWGGCLNPQPDTSPLVTRPAEPGASIDVSPPDDAESPSTGLDREGAAPVPASPTDPIRPGPGADAGAALPDAGTDEPSGGEPAVTPFASGDAAALDAGTPAAPDGD